MIRALAFACLLAAALVQVHAETFGCSCSGCDSGYCPLAQTACSGYKGSFSCAGTAATCSDVSVDSCTNYDTTCKAYCSVASCSAYVATCASSSSCFPAHATVQLEDGTTKTMAQLESGDRVLVANGQFSDVYMFSHQDAEAVTSFVKIVAERHTLMLTSGHYLYVNGKLATAKTVKVGDKVEDAQGKQVTVSAVSTVRANGLYNPHTLQGDVVVNGIKTSTYTEAITPALAHAALWPVRMAYTLGQDIVGGAFAEGSEAIASALPNGKDAY